jgi:hypothetical protein
VAIGFNARGKRRPRSVALVDGNASGLRGFAVGFNAAASGTNVAIALEALLLFGTQIHSSVAIGQSCNRHRNYTIALALTMLRLLLRLEQLALLR